MRSESASINAGSLGSLFSPIWLLHLVSPSPFNLQHDLTLGVPIRLIPYTPTPWHRRSFYILDHFFHGQKTRDKQIFRNSKHLGNSFARCDDILHTHVCLSIFGWVFLAFCPGRWYVIHPIVIGHVVFTMRIFLRKRFSSCLGCKLSFFLNTKAISEWPISTFHPIG